MVSLFNALNITSNALKVNESAISVVSHNVANMNTEGYSKQRVNLATRNIGEAIGDNTEAQIRTNGGVKIASVVRYNDNYLNSYYRNQLSILKQYEAELGSIGDLASIFNDLEGEGISGALADFYEAVNNLNEYPASSTARVNFIQSAKTLTETLNAKSGQLDELTTQALGDGSSRELLESSKIYSQYAVFNDKLKELASVNKALQVTQTGTLQANNLLDQRDLILNDLAQFVDMEVEESPVNGSVTIYVGGEVLVQGAKIKGEFKLQTAEEFCKANGMTYPTDWYVKDDAGNPVLDEFGNPKKREAAVISIVSQTASGEEVIVANANSMITKGSIGGLLHSGDVDAEGINPGVAQQKLNIIAEGIAKLFNDLNTRAGAYYIDPTNTNVLKATDNTNYIFVNGNNGTTDITAGNITINSDLLTDNGCWKIACAYFDDPANFDPNAIGNAKNVIDMLGTRNQKLTELGNMSIEDYYTNLLGKVAAGGSNSQALVDTQADVVDSIHNQILSNNSVDLNEELVDLVKYQTAYAAAAQVFNACNSCLDTLISLGG